MLDGYRRLDQRVFEGDTCRGGSLVRNDEIQIARGDVDALDCKGRAAGEPPIDAGAVETLSRLLKRIVPRSRFEPRCLTEKRFDVSLKAIEDSVSERAWWKASDVPTVLVVEEKFLQRESKRGLVRFDEEAIAVGIAKAARYEHC
jgi:hypothetical protein